MKAEPQQEHQWLHKLIGEWSYEHESTCAPDQPPVKVTGTERVRSLGDLWVLCEGQGEMPGAGTSYSLITFGYDPAKKRFVGSFISSVMTHFWVYDGELDSSSKVLSLNAEGPSFTVPGQMAQYKDVIEFKSDNERTLTAYVLTDGQWNEMMRATYRRVK